MNSCIVACHFLNVHSTEINGTEISSYIFHVKVYLLDTKSFEILMLTDWISSQLKKKYFRIINEVAFSFNFLIINFILKNNITKLIQK